MCRARALDAADGECSVGHAALLPGGTREKSVRRRFQHVDEFCWKTRRRRGKVRLRLIDLVANAHWRHQGAIVDRIHLDLFSIMT